MAVREILKMGDPRLLRVAQPVTAFDTPEMRQLLVDMHETMVAANGAGLAAPQIGVEQGPYHSVKNRFYPSSSIR